MRRRRTLDFPRGISQGLANDGQRGLLVGEGSDPEGPETPGLVVLGEDWLPSAMEPASPSVACKSTKRKPGSSACRATGPRCHTHHRPDALRPRRGSCPRVARPSFLDRRRRGRTRLRGGRRVVIISKLGVDQFDDDDVRLLEVLCTKVVDGATVTDAAKPLSHCEP
jgi:hypothetical protein